MKKNTARTVLIHAIQICQAQEWVVDRAHLEAAMNNYDMELIHI